MAKRTRKSRVKKSKGYQGADVPRKTSPNMILIAGVGVVVLGLLAFGMFQVFGFGTDEPATAQAAIQVDSGGLETVNVEDGENLASVAKPVDRESQYLGLDSDPDKLALAEVGQIGKPTLVWFHADW